MSDTMTGKERFFAALDGVEPDRVPVDPVLDAMLPTRVIGQTVDKFFLSSEMCAGALRAAWERFGFDAVQMGCMSCQYPELFGAQCSYPKDGYPVLRGADHVFNSLEELERAEVPDPWSVPSFRVMLETIRELAQTLGERAAVGVRSPGVFNVARYLIGTELLFEGLAIRPELVHRAASLACEALIRVTEAAIEVGAQYVWYPDAVSSPAFLSPRQYEQFAMQYHARFFTTAQKAGARTIYHPCGGEYPILIQVRQVAGVDAYHFSELVDVGIVRQIYGPDVTLWGNVDPHVTLLMQSPEEVEAAVRSQIERAAVLGRFIMSPGCSTPGNMPEANLSALTAAARKYGQYPMI